MKGRVPGRVTISIEKSGVDLNPDGDALACEIVSGLGNGDFLMSGSKFLQESSP
jgi:hypothetical protein